MFPKFAIEIISSKFTAEQVVTITENWGRFGDQRFSFSNSTKAQILREASTVLNCAEVYSVKAKAERKDQSTYERLVAQGRTQHAIISASR